MRGWFSQPDPFNWDITRFAYAPDIRRFDNGTPGVMAAAASLPALDWHAGQDRGAMLAHIMDEARRRGYRRLSLETGSGPAFEPAHAMYERRGFVRCGPFGDYRADSFSVFMTLEL